jgi:hypothetical protein
MKAREQEYGPPEGTKDNSSRFSEDSLIRDAGFGIHSRPSDGTVLWIRGSKIVTHNKALRIAIRERKRKESQAGGV